MHGPFIRFANPIGKEAKAERGDKDPRPVPKLGLDQRDSIIDHRQLFPSHPLKREKMLFQIKWALVAAALLQGAIAGPGEESCMNIVVGFDSNESSQL
jgi:hypothetical protein